MIILSLELHNFKAHNHRHIDFGGMNAVIRGANGVGKTSIFDSMCFCLTGKDSLGRSDADLMKPLTGIPRDDVMYVEGVFEHNGETVTLRRVVYENWVKKHGSLEKHFDGNKTDYYINGSEVDGRAYEAYLSSICDADTMKLLSNATYFSEKLDNKKRREILMKLGDVSDAEVLDEMDVKASCEFTKLFSLNKSVTQLKADTEKAAKDLKPRYERIKHEISGIQSTLPNVTGLVEGVISEHIGIREITKNRLIGELSALQSDAEVNALQAQIKTLEAEIAKITAEDDAKYEREKSRLYGEMQNAQNETNRARMNLEHTKKVLLDYAQRVAKRALLDLDDAEALEFSEESVCPKCGQDIPPDSIYKAFNAFEATKSAAVTKYAALLADAQKQVEFYENMAAEQEKEMLHWDEELQLARKNYQAHLEAFSESRPCIDKWNEIQRLKDKISIIQSGKADAITAKQKEIAECEKQIGELQTDLYKLKEHKRLSAEIAEKATLEKQLAKEYEELQRILALCKEFDKAKMELVTEKIKGHFKYATFKLFDIPQEGEPREICEIEYQGRPYSMLSTGERIFIGCDIVRALMKVYGVTMPVFIDNAESITLPLDIDAQVIRLIADKDTPTLNIEIEKGD